ncbi:MAG: hypothetical protein NTX05_07585 [Fusobacteria bacterium]|nr:hypothetical protein [Fusobacteriota bacterium]
MEGKVKVVEKLDPKVLKIIKKLVFANRTSERIVELLSEKGYVSSSNKPEVLEIIKIMKQKKRTLGKILFILGIVLIVASLIVVGIGLSEKNPRTPYIDVIIAGYIIYIGIKLKKIVE